MNIYIDVFEMRDGRGTVVSVGAKARIDSSPSDGYDPSAVEKLERELGPLVQARLLDALKTKRRPRLNCERFTTATEAWEAYDEWVESYRSKGKTPPLNEFGWLFAPCEEGGANG